MRSAAGDPVTLFLCGDVMLGRGIDQILPHPGDPVLQEPYVRDARVYVGLAEAVNGPVPREGGYSWPWGDALEVLDEVAPDVRVLNLETSITRSGDFAPGKQIHYRMNPANIPALAVARPDVCVLANNHVLDFGVRGLVETLDVLEEAGLDQAGAGRDDDEARRPAIVPLPGGGRVLVFAVAMPSSGVPAGWAAAPDRPGVAFLPGATREAAADMVARVREVKRPGDIAVVSIHWGSNWGYEVEDDQVEFAHALVDGGVDLVHGHSSHHPRPIEVYRDRLIIYGCGDFINDYEGISGYEAYRDDLRLMYFATAEAASGRLLELRMAPMRAVRLRLRHARGDDREWLRATLDHACRDFGTRVVPAPGGTLALAPPG
ncbi:CapA family protein [Microbispora hainanensis]|uniref:CapA family protein n=1 Tax=Microbispora hainanensis TaxID=568844 RepID=A0ABZ1SPX4_9ACTN|nr:CapA family protein [Microbispora hainanensis]